jgi:hypothetical protein
MSRRTAALAAATFTTLTTLTACGDDQSSQVDDALPATSEATTAAPESESHRLTVLVEDGDAPEAVVDVPPGFDDDDSGWYVVSRDRRQFLGLMTVGRVDADACRHGARDAVDPGPSMRDLADALVAQRSTRAARPDRVSVAGHPALYVELRGPADTGKCDRHPALWREPERGFYVDDQVDQVWILEVAGQRIVVDASYQAGRSSPSDISRLREMVESLEFA